MIGNGWGKWSEMESLRKIGGAVKNEGDRKRQETIERGAQREM